MFKSFARIGLYVLAGCLLLTGGCSTTDRHDEGGYSKASGADTLYARLGGKKAIEAVVDDFVDRLADDPKVNVTRQGTANTWEATPAHVRQIKKMITLQICDVTGGPQKYTGRDMRTAHRGMQITETEFDLSARRLRDSLEKFNVPKQEQDELINIVASTRPEIVGL